MYTTLPPRPGDPSLGKGWGLLRAVRLAFPDSAELTRDEVHTKRLGVYLTDLLGQYKVGLEPGALERGGQSYGEMAEALIKVAVPDGESVDLLVLAYAVPDITPGRATATYLSHVCPGRPLAFAVSDQGAAAGFTGLRLIQDFARTGGPRRALLLVVEQAELPYDSGLPVAVPTGHSAVALVFGDHAERLDSVSVSVSPVASDAALANQVGDQLAASAGATKILGAGLAGQISARSGPGRVRIAPAGMPYTGVWWELARALVEAETGGQFLLADYAPESQYLCFATIDPRLQ